jgi:flagellar basal-body rod modification protein FlgD
MQGISSVAPGSGASSGGFSALSSEDFAKIIFTELSKQDPLQPNDTNALLEQISMIRSIEADQNLSDRLGSLVGQNEFSNAATLIGRRIEGLNEINLRVSGVVRSVARTNQGPVLTLTDGSRVAMSRIDGVHEIREGT